MPNKCILQRIPGSKKGEFCILLKSLHRSECYLCFGSKTLRQWKEPRSVIYFLPLKLGIEQINKVPGIIKISYLLVEIFERPLNISKRPFKESIDILYNYGPGVRGTTT